MAVMHIDIKAISTPIADTEYCIFGS